MSSVQQRDIWLQNLRSLQADSLDVNLCDLPSLFDLEIAFRRVSPGKAVGSDGFLPELCHHYPAQLARLSFAQLMKLVALHGQEALCHKVVTAYKRGQHSLCESFRSLLISSAATATWRQTANSSVHCSPPSKSLFESQHPATEICGPHLP